MTFLNIIYRRNIKLTGTLQQVACRKIRFFSLFATGDVSRGGTSATQWRKFHTDDVNHTIESSKNIEITMGQIIYLFFLFDTYFGNSRLDVPFSKFIFVSYESSWGPGGGIPDFKWHGWLNGGKNQNPKKSVELQTNSKEFLGHKIFRGTTQPEYLGIIHGNYHKPSDCFEYPTKSVLKSSYPRNYLPNFPYPKKSFDYPCHLKSWVLLPPLGSWGSCL